MLLINSGDENSFAALYCSAGLAVVYSSEFKNAARGRLPDNLINCIEKLSDNYRDEFEKIKAIAVTIGPGSFTGIRVGLSIAKGIASALGVPVIPISNFELTYSRIPTPDSGQKYCMLIAAKLPEYYYSIWFAGKEQKKGCINIDELSSILDEKSTIVANFDDETKRKHSYFALTNTKNLEDEAGAMLRIAISYFEKGSFKNSPEIEPLYMKDFRIIKH